MTTLLPVTDADFDWLAGRAAGSRKLTLPPEGLERPEILLIVRGIVQRLEAANYAGSWMIVADDEIVGLCNFIGPPSNGDVELGYGVAAGRRNRGHATAAVAGMLAAARADPGKGGAHRKRRQGLLF